MPRPGIPTDLVASLLDTRSGKGLVALLHVSYDDGTHTGDIFAVRNDEDCTYDGNTYVASWFTVSIPPEDATIIPQMRVEIGDVTREVRQAIEQLDPRYPATLSVNYHLLSELPNLTTAPVLPFTGTLRRIRTDQFMVSGEIELFDNIAQEPITPFLMSPAYGFPSLRER